MGKITLIKSHDGANITPVADARGVMVGNEFLDDVLKRMINDGLANVKDIRSINKVIGALPAQIAAGTAKAEQSLTESEEVIAAYLTQMEDRIEQRTRALTSLAIGDEPKSGDVCYVTKGGDKKTIPWMLYQRTMGTPIGVVVIPPSHTPDGTTRIVSLCNMSLQTPAVGSLADTYVNGDNYMMWGRYGEDIDSLETIDKIAVLDEDGTSVGLSGYGYMKSDIPDGMYISGIGDMNIDAQTYVDGYVVMSGYCFYFEMYRDSTDDEWDVDVEFGNPVVPSPYGENDATNVLYLNQDSVTSRLDGAENTEAIVQHMSQAYRDGDVVQNVQEAYPAANCCSRFLTEGTDAGEWYLPSIGELGYLWARIVEINRALASLGADALCIRYTPDYLWLWSSSEYSRYTAWGLTTNNGDARNYNKYYTGLNNRVRAFLRFS